MDIDAFIQCVENNPDRSNDTVRAYRSDLVLFDRFLKSNKLRVTQVTHAVVHDYIQHLNRQPNLRFGKIGLSRATIRRRLFSIRRYFEFLRATTNSKLRDPTYGIKTGDLNNDDCKAVDESTIDTLLAGVTTARDKVLISLFLSSGLRLSELHQLDRETIETDQADEDGETTGPGSGVIFGKRRKKRRFCIDAETTKALVDYLACREDDLPALFISERRQRMSKRAIQYTLTTWCKRLGLSPMHVHQLRHQFATRLGNAGIDSGVLKALMGHSDLKTTDRYCKLYDDTIARQYHAAMEFVRGPEA
jgi:site-specific recombinase XerD